MSSAVLRIGEFGAVLRRRIRALGVDSRVRPFDLTGATVTFRFQNPADDTTIDVAATVADAERGLAEYVTEEGVLDAVGVWLWSAIVESAGGRWESEAAELPVEAGLPEPPP